MSEPDRLFRKAVRDATPLKKTSSGSSQSKPSISSSSNSQKSPSDSGRLELDGDLFYRSGVQKKTLKDLKRGRLGIVDTLDLHGYNRSAAITAVRCFVDSLPESGHRCILIITGKGRNSPDRLSVVRLGALDALRQHSRVMAYCCARPADGGYGAFYVLLRR